MTTRLLAVAALAALAALLPGSAQPGAQQAPQSTLLATVGPGFEIALTSQEGQPVTSLREGTYTIRVSDRAAIHNFHLFGPGVDQMTAVPETTETTWTVNLRPGGYAFVCDPHPRTMKGTFAVEAAPRPARVSAPMDTRQTVGLRTPVRGASGMFAGTLERSGADTLTWRMTLRRLSGRALSAHIHFGRPGRSGGIAAPLCAPCRASAAGRTALSPRALRALRSGAAYVNVHTRRNPAGEIRGQLVVES